MQSILLSVRVPLYFTHLTDSDGLFVSPYWRVTLWIFPFVVLEHLTAPGRPCSSSACWSHSLLLFYLSHLFLHLTNCAPLPPNHPGSRLPVTLSTWWKPVGHKGLVRTPACTQKLPWPCPWAQCEECRSPAGCSFSWPCSHDWHMSVEPLRPWDSVVQVDGVHFLELIEDRSH